MTLATDAAAAFTSPLSPRSLVPPTSSPLAWCWATDNEIYAYWHDENGQPHWSLIEVWCTPTRTELYLRAGSVVEPDWVDELVSDVEAALSNKRRMWHDDAIESSARRALDGRPLQRAERLRGYVESVGSDDHAERTALVGSGVLGRGDAAEGE